MKNPGTLLVAILISTGAQAAEYMEEDTISVIPGILSRCHYIRRHNCVGSRSDRNSGQPGRQHRK